MKTQLIFSTLIFLLLLACQPTTDCEDQLLASKSLLQKAKKALAEQEGDLIHTLYFSFRDTVSEKGKKSFEITLAALGEVDEVSGFSLGKVSTVEDPRHPFEFDVVVKMVFKSEEDLAAYQQDSTHLAVKKQLGKYLKGVKVLDYLRE